MRRDLILCLAAGCLGFVGAMMIRPAGGHPDFSDTAPPRVVVSMTSHRVTGPGCCESYSFYRVWSDGFTEWNRRGINWDYGTVNWRGWESIDEDTGPY